MFVLISMHMLIVCARTQEDVYQPVNLDPICSLYQLQVYDNRPYVVKAYFGDIEVTEVLFKEGMKVKKLQPLFGYKSKDTELEVGFKLNSF